MACGDSLTTGLCDPGLPAGTKWRGWPDRVAEVLAGAGSAGPDDDAQQDGLPGLQYANLAVPGVLMRQICREQVPEALRMGADLISILGGGNDLLRLRCDLDDLVAELDEAVRLARAAGARVLLGTAYDPASSTVLRALRGRAAVMTAGVWSVARRREVDVLDLWSLHELREPAMWAQDRIHLSAAGHALVARRALLALGVARASTATWAEAGESDSLAVRYGALHAARPAEGSDWRDDVRWVRDHLVPHLGRRLRGIGPGEDQNPKRPMLTPMVLPGSSTAGGGSAEEPVSEESLPG